VLEIIPALFISFKKSFEMATPNIIASEFVRNYISLLNESDVNEALSKNGKAFRKLLKHIPPYKVDYAYATDKWTIKEIVQHVIDSERVFTYRAMSFARMDAAPLPGFEENSWATNAHTSTRKWEDLLDEFKSLRKATKLLFASFTDEDMQHTGTADNKPINVAALGFLLAGHVQHHINIINERYL
jgi:hypothetical protein